MLPRIAVTSTPEGNPLLETVTRSYVDSVVAVGGLPLVVGAMSSRMVDELLDTVDGVILSAGGESTRRYGQDPSPEVGGSTRAATCGSWPCCGPRWTGGCRSWASAGACS